MKKIGDMTVNDGNGLYDNEGLCDSLLMDLNRTQKLLIDNQFIAFCDLIAKMGQKINNLKKGVRSDLDAKDEEIADLKRLNNELAEKAFGLPVDTGEEKTEGNDDGGH